MSEVHERLESPLVALPGVGHMPAPGEDEKEAARAFLCGGYASYAEVGDRGRRQGQLRNTVEQHFSPKYRY